MKRRNDGKNNPVIRTCPDDICVEGARVDTTTATARGKALGCLDCAYPGVVSQELENPFRLKVVDMFDGKPVPFAQVTYEVIRYTNLNVTSGGLNGATMRLVRDGYTDYDGLSQAYLKLGTLPGVYVVRARCDDCLEVPEQIPTGTAYSRPDVVIETESETAGDPTPNCGPCPSGCCPCTPLLRVRTETEEDDGTFTSAAGENVVQLGGLVLPLCLNASNSITWDVDDAPRDFIDSGRPVQPAAGAASSFAVGSGRFPRPPQGRALPLAYKVTATYVHNGTPVTSVTGVKQDEIDKCRQEYVDFGIPLTEVPRSTFTLGFSEFVDVSGVRDCYAHIFPHQRAAELRRIQGLLDFGIDVMSGYRSPRKNFSTPGASATSWHMYGKAIDIEPSPENAANYQILWNTSNFPKMLERQTRPQIILKRNSAGTLVIGQEILSVFQQTNWMHLGE